jgi:small subunit ribosomal protein S2
MRDLLEAGIHFGHQTHRWNPKMSRYIFGERNGIYIIDLQKSMRQLRRAYALVRDTVAEGGTVLFVGTKKQAQETVAREADRCGMYYVNHRWLGGTLTNWQTIRQSVQTLLALEELETTGKIEQYPKKEQIQMRKQREKMDKNLRGIKGMSKPADVMFVIDTKREGIAVREAERLGMDCIGICDTNADPDTVALPVPGNDDAIRAIGLFCSTIADAVIEGQSLAEKRQSDKAQQAQLARAAKAAERAEGSKPQAVAEVVAVEEEPLEASADAVEE